MEGQKIEMLESQKQPPEEQLGGGTTFLRTCFNGVNVMSGVGMLSVSYALSRGGWVSLALLFLVAIVCSYTGFLIRRCMDAHPNTKTYPDIAQLAFGIKGRTMVATFVYLKLYLSAVEYLILEGDNLEKLFPDMAFKVAGLKFGGKQGFVLLSALVILPTTWMRSLGLLAYVSAGGVFASVIVVGCVFWAGAVDGVGFHGRGMTLNWSGLPTTISLFIFCFSDHEIFPTLRTSMKDTSKFSKVLLTTFAISTANYASMATLGYLIFGEHTRSQVTLNLPAGKMNSKVAIYTIVVSILARYAIIITPIANAMEDTFSIRNDRRLISITMRTVLVSSTVVVALAVPFFGYMLEFIGAFLGVSTSMLFPCILYLKINNASRTFWLEWMVIIAIIVLGSFVAVAGTYNSLKEIISHL